MFSVKKLSEFDESKKDQKQMSSKYFQISKIGQHRNIGIYKEIHCQTNEEASVLVAIGKQNWR